MISLLTKDGKEESHHFHILRTWGYLAMVNILINKKRKLGPKTVGCVFLGYAHHSTNYRFVVIKSEALDVLVDTILES